ncbi:nuclear transport factor 2 family protein [Streptomyces sp. LBL]|uniref:nuclear transport factor 2 family protein n=1 Tax=Streptomyces sp. LBL TaxID=2940562 RepID=UPI00247374D8|nr:nuclear transport factor 2 family protein [Streptomyces sp. LBL]
MTTDAQTSRTVAKKFVERLAKHDPDGIQELFAEEIDWHVPGSDALPWTGRRTRREEVAPYFTTMWSQGVHHTDGHTPDGRGRPDRSPAPVRGHPDRRRGVQRRLSKEYSRAPRPGSRAARHAHPKEQVT